MRISKNTLRKQVIHVILFAAIPALVSLVACSTSTVGTATPKETGTETAVPFTGSMNINPSKAPAGTSVTVSGTGFPAGAGFDLMWHTVKGSWDIQGNYREEYHGRVFEETKYAIAEVTTDGQGSFSKTITIPEDYGFNHNITIERGDEVLNRVGFLIEPTIDIEPTSGPPGTPITVTLHGNGWQGMYNNWTLMYDNKYTGFLSAVTTAGTSRVVIPAAGLPGKHMIKVMTGAYQYPYLNGEQDPFDQPIFTVGFDITDGEPVLPPPAEEQGLAVMPGVAPPAGSGPTLWTDPARSPIETPFSVHGTAFPAGKQVQLTWYSVVGNRVSGSGWDEVATELGTVTVQSDGTLSLPLSAPDDLGGSHRIEAKVNGEKIAETEFVITPSILPLNVTSGKAGTPLTVHVKGVGWTETSNIYHLVYDNAYLGYACGFNSQGDITINLPLAGDPGWHFIDLYPGIYKGKEAAGVQSFRTPQLTYQDDHPGERLPAFHFAVKVTE